MFMPLFGILFLVLIVWAILSLSRGGSLSGYADSSSRRADSALEILKRRYARGEVSRAEYEEKKKDLI
jgi:putative membrane protein